jgi:hypothetical protein
MHLTGQEMIIKRAINMMENNFRDIEKAADIIQPFFILSYAGPNIISISCLKCLQPKSCVTSMFSKIDGICDLGMCIELVDHRR